MKNQTTSLIIILVITSLIIFSIAILGRTQVLDISKNLENLNTLKFFDQFSEALLKSITYKIVEESVFEVANNSLGNYLWYNYPDCGYRPPTLDELNNHLSNTIKSKLSKTEEFIKLANMLKVFYPLEIYYKFDDITIEFPFDENDLNSGALDEGFPVTIRNVSIHIKTPFGETRKVYDFSLYVNRTRLYYMYRKINDWLNNTEYINLIKKVEREKGYIYRCNYGYVVFVTPNYVCSANEKIKCDGRKVIVKKKENITTIREDCLDLSQASYIKQQNQEIEQTCNHEYEEEECEPDESTCKTTYATLITSKYNKMGLSTYRFAVGGSGGGSSGGGGGGGGTPPGSSCEIVPILSCINITVDKRYTNEQCTVEYQKNPGLSGPPCPDGIQCPEEGQIRNILEALKKELKNNLSNLFDEFVSCTVDLKIYEIKCYQTINNKNIGTCSCGIAGKADMKVMAEYFIKCTDSKYYSFVENSLKNLELYFKLGVKGITNCPSGDFPSSLSVQCCDVYDTKNGKDCCSDVDENGNCVECPQESQTITDIKSTINAMCLS